MPTEIKMPQLGESVAEGTIGKWLKHLGEPVAKYEPLVEVITDKVNVEMPSPFAGVLQKILVEEGQTVATGTVIALLEESAVAARGGGSGTRPAPAPTKPEPASRAPSSSGPSRADGEQAGSGTTPQPRDRTLRLSPLVRRLAEEHRLPVEELETIKGSGEGGRITKDDVLRYLRTRTPGTAPSQAVRAAAPPRGMGDELRPLSPLRRTIAERMARSAREIPHAFGVIEVDVTTLVRHRDTYKEGWRAKEGVNVSITAFVVGAASRALRAFPIVNSTFTPEGIVYKQAIHFGVGVAIPDGLIVPVIKNADQRPVVGLAKEIDALVTRARQGKLTLDDVSGGTFTLTNPGVFGSLFSMPVINYPQAAILSTDAIVRRPVVVGEGIAIRDILHLGLAFDHRVFDGAVAMQFLTHIKRQLEEFTPRGDSPEFADTEAPRPSGSRGGVRGR
jgi:2-oxoisovalerate dehydrogenase E2 component (dihydrolipoyl transacylase)